MARFKYTYKDPGGGVYSDTIEANSISEARMKIMSEGKFLMKLQPESKLSFAGSSSRLRKINKKDQSIMFKQLSFMQQSGMQLHSSLKTLAKSSPNKGIKASLEKLDKGIRNDGKKLYAALFDQQEIYGVVIPNQIKAGEETGELANTMSSIGDTLDKEAKFNQKIKSAMVYPIMILLVTVGIVYFLMTSVVPSMTKSISSMGGEMPALTVAVMKFSELVQNYGLLSFGVLVAAAVVFGLFYRTLTAFRFSVDTFLIKLPMIGDVLLKLKLVQFCRLYGTLSKSGVPVEQSFNIVKGAMGNLYLESKVAKVRDLIVQEGRRIDSAMADVGIFPEILVQLIMVGESAAKMPEVLEMMATYFEEEVDNTLGTVLKYIDTLLIIVIGAIVGVVVVSMFLPMFGIIDTL